MRQRPLEILFAAILLCLCGSTQKGEAKNGHCLIGASDLVDPMAPRFDQYAVNIPASVSHATLDTQSNPVARTYRTVLRREMSEGANFAGHYRLAVWGCGSSCAMFAVVNLNTGRVITSNTIHSVSGVHFGADGFLPDTESDSWGFPLQEE